MFFFCFFCQGDPRPVKVALLDDGVKSSYAGLDDNIKLGNSWFEIPRSSRRNAFRGKPNQGLAQNYNTSLYSHGTVMAYYIRRVCPRVQFYVAKLNAAKTDATSRSKVSFTIKSAAEVSFSSATTICLLCRRTVTLPDTNCVVGHRMGSETERGYHIDELGHRCRGV